MMEEHKETLVLGASTHPERYSFKAINMLKAHQHPVLAVGRQAGEVAGVPIATAIHPNWHPHTVTLYLNAANQVPFYEQILALKPQRIIFNPGTENMELVQLAAAAGIEALEACTLVLLQTRQF
ncbi:MAG: CoA-binding protein [Chitinophagales bacterium]